MTTHDHDHVHHHSLEDTEFWLAIGRATLAETPMPWPWHWVSICDNEAPTRQQFRGVVILDAPEGAGTIPARLIQLGIPVTEGDHALEMSGHELGDAWRLISPSLRLRLLTTRAELEMAGADWSESDGVPVDEQ